MEMSVKDNLGDGSGRGNSIKSTFDNYATRKCNGRGNGGGSDNTFNGVAWGSGSGSGSGHRDKYCGECLSFGLANGMGNYTYLKENYPSWIF